MRLGIMQPYFFPYAGYFGLMGTVDRWIVFDTPQYIRKGWVNRNRVRSMGSEPWKYIRVPVAKAPRETPICKMQLAAPGEWLSSLVGHLDFYRVHQAPYYDDTMDLLRGIEQSCRKEMERPGDLAQLLIGSTRAVAKYLDLLPKRFDVFSEMSCSLPPIQHAGEWALRICEAVGATQYYNPIGGLELFDARQFAEAGIQLRFFEPELPEYEQGPPPFVNGLSILDLLMWQPPSVIRELSLRHNLVFPDSPREG